MSRTGRPAPIPRGYRRSALRVGGVTLTVRARSLAVAATLAGMIALLGIAALGLGTYPLTPAKVMQVLVGGGGALDQTVVFAWRLPRTVAAIVLGGCLAVAGAVFQGVTRNPLASPDLLGLSNGAFTGMLLSVVVFNASWPLMTAGAVIGGLTTAALIWVLAFRGGVQGFRLIVIGIGVAAVLGSTNTWLLLQVELDTAMFASAWGAGTLNGVTATPVGGAILCAVPLLLLVMGITPQLQQLELGDDVARATGVRTTAVRSVALLAAVGLVSVSTAVIGPVAFIALAGPQIARRIAATPHLSSSLSGLVGAVLLLTSDLIAQHVLPATLPVGVVTVSIGGLYLVITLMREVRRRA